MPALGANSAQTLLDILNNMIAKDFIPALPIAAFAGLTRAAGVAVAAVPSIVDYLQHYNVTVAGQLTNIELQVVLDALAADPTYSSSYTQLQLNSSAPKLDLIRVAGAAATAAEMLAATDAIRQPYLTVHQRTVLGNGIFGVANTTTFANTSAPQKAALLHWLNTRSLATSTSLSRTELQHVLAILNDTVSGTWLQVKNLAEPAIDLVVAPNNAAADMTRHITEAITAPNLNIDARINIVAGVFISNLILKPRTESPQERAFFTWLNTVKPTQAHELTRKELQQLAATLNAPGTRLQVKEGAAIRVVAPPLGLPPLGWGPADIKDAVALAITRPNLPQDARELFRANQNYKRYSDDQLSRLDLALCTTPCANSQNLSPQEEAQMLRAAAGSNDDVIVRVVDSTCCNESYEYRTLSGKKLPGNGDALLQTRSLLRNREQAISTAATSFTLIFSAALTVLAAFRDRAASGTILASNLGAALFILPALLGIATGVLKLLGDRTKANLETNSAALKNAGVFLSSESDNDLGIQAAAAHP